MEYPIGIEMSKEYLAYEVSKSAYKLVKEVLLVQPGENVVVTGDTSKSTGCNYECSLYFGCESCSCICSDK